MRPLTDRARRCIQPCPWLPQLVIDARAARISFPARICHLWAERDSSDSPPAVPPVCPTCVRSRFTLSVTSEITYILMSEVLGYKSHLLDTASLFDQHPVRGVSCTEGETSVCACPVVYGSLFSLPQRKAKLSRAKRAHRNIPLF